MEIPHHSQPRDLGLAPLGVRAEFLPLAIPLNYINSRHSQLHASQNLFSSTTRNFWVFQHSLSQICLEDNAGAYGTPASVNEDHADVPMREHIPTATVPTSLHSYWEKSP